MNPEDLFCPKCKKTVDEILEFMEIDGEKQAKFYRCRPCYDEFRKDWEMACFAERN